MFKIIRKNIEKKLTRLTSTNLATKQKSTDNVQPLKSRKQFLVPAITQDKLKNISSVVGLHVATYGISWAKLSSEGNVLHAWDVVELKQLPKRSLPVDIFPIVKDVVDKIPQGDVYIFEVPESSSPLSNKPASLNFTNHQLMFSSILVTLLNTRKSVDKWEFKTSNNIYYIKSKLPARLFGLLVGTERVSGLPIISKIFENSQPHLQCTPVNINNTFQDLYNQSSSVDKELLGQSLMIAMCFIDLCVYKNSKSIATVSKIKRQSK